MVVVAAMSLAMAQPHVSVSRVPTLQGAPVEVTGGGAQFNAFVDLADPRMSSAVVSRPDGDWLIVDLAVRLGPESSGLPRIPERIEVGGRTRWRVGGHRQTAYTLSVELDPGTVADVRVGAAGMAVDALQPVSMVGTRLDAAIRPGAQFDHRVALRLGQWERGGTLNVPLTYRLEPIESDIPQVSDLHSRAAGRRVRLDPVRAPLGARTSPFPQRERR
jgi:hypothetical protein